MIKKTQKSQTPAGALSRAKPDTPAAPVFSMELYRVAPAGTHRKVIERAQEILRAAAARITEDTWCQGLEAAGDGWFECHPLDPAAKAWSLSGSMAAETFKNPASLVLGGSAEDIAWQALSLSIRIRHQNVSIGWFNHNIAHEVSDVHAEIEAARALLDQRMKGMKRGS